MTVKTEYRTYQDCFLDLDRYRADRTLAINIYNETDGHIATITKCLDTPGNARNESYIDENNCPWAADFIKAYNLGEHTGKWVQSGYCTYPLYRFNMDELKKYVADMKNACIE